MKQPVLKPVFERLPANAPVRKVSSVWKDTEHAQEQMASEGLSTRHAQLNGVEERVENDRVVAVDPTMTCTWLSRFSSYA